MADKILFNVKNWTLDQLLDLDPVVFNSLNKTELVDVVSRIGTVGTRRIQAVAKAGLKTPATWNTEMRTYRQDITGKKTQLNKLDLNELRRQYVRTKGFLQAPTSTVTGGRRWVKESIEGLKEHGVELTPDEFDLFWQAYEAAKDFVPGLGDAGFKYAVLGTIKSRIDKKKYVGNTSGNIADLANYILTHKDEVYKRYAKAQREAEEQRAAEIMEQLTKREDGNNGLFNSGELFEENGNNSSGGFGPSNR